MRSAIKNTATRIVVVAVVMTGGGAALATAAIAGTAQPTAVAHLADGEVAPTPTPTPTNQNGNTPWG
ncbi:hypothetical protein Skr01_53500 [Sphaerisporangium krabiense]|uniref:Uncharacterized protein n=1 Tax=Sphaerisporangium krabiense TaxID=763782 RepID=A0A7W8Z466_9ACTN|nr:hypothetical protein [Sphaerisporangium krabiense]MBB5627109.1 hypothetical protein [Sphaerisporangium krabiense]GII65265.1 hypothetical protein Skr01_53500 [Sphaerisporangium krabiense]